MKLKETLERERERGREGTNDVGGEEEVFVGGGEFGLEGVELILRTGAADYGVAPLGHLNGQCST